MKYLFPALNSVQGKLQSQLMRFAAVFLFLISITLTLSPTVKYQSWNTALPVFHWLGFFIWIVVFSWIHYLTSTHLPSLDPYLLPIISLLSGWGLITIWRLDVVFGIKQSLWLVVAALLFYGGTRYPIFISLLRRYKYIWLSTGLLLTSLTFIFGTYPGGEGPNLWLNFGGIYLQPSEPLKLLLIIYLAAYFADRSPIRLNIFRLLAPTAILIASAAYLLFAQRDLGTALVFIMLYFIMTYVASGNGWILSVSGVFIILAGILGYQTFNIIQQRFDTWMNLWADPMGNSYQVIQSLIATASGGILGRGTGLGFPGVVPIAHSDFIFTSIAEEFGLIGTIGLVILYIILTLRAIKISLLAPNNYRRFLAAGLASYFSLQGLLIIAGNINLAPLSGVTLPFVSYGGSSLLASFSAALILVVISDQIETEPVISLKTRPFLVLGGFFLFAWLLLAITNGYWVLLRGDDLIKRTDNPRIALDDNFVQRGNLLDRNNQPLTKVTGVRGEYNIEIVQPALSHVVGYSSLYFGQAGLEQSLGPYLRGLQGNPSSLVWTNYLLYSQRPPGLDVRLSLDIELQQKADEMLGEAIGAVVLINAESGEILTLASHPYYDANQLAEKWDQWNSDTNAPFLNRATQGQYYPGTSLAPFILYKYLEKRELPPVPQVLSLNVGDEVISCVRAPASTTDWGQVIANGCPGPVIALADTLTIKEITDLSSLLGFYTAPTISLPVAQPDSPDKIAFNQNSIIGFDSPRISPLQMTLAAAIISNNGIRPDATLVLAVNTPHQGWVILPQDAPTTSFNRTISNQVMDLLSVPSTFFWQSLGFGNGADGVQTTWFIGGTTQNWQGSPLAIVVLVERSDPDLVINIGRTMLEETTTSKGD